MTDQQTTDTTTATDTAAPTQTAADTTTAQQTVADNTQQTSTVLDGDNKQVTTTVAADYPDDWREKMAGADEKKLNMLKRLASPKAMADAYLEAQQRIRSGNAKPLTAESTPEEISEYRKANGIPESVDKYDLNLGDGFIIGDNDKPQVNKFLEAAHSANMTDAQAKTALKTYFQMQNDASTQFLQKQAEQKDSAQTELRKEFGQQYDRNINLLKGYIQNQFGDASDVLMGAIDATGTPLMNQPNVIRKFLQLAMDHDPIGASLPGLGMQGIDTIDNELKTLETRIKTDRKGYFRDDKAQARYGELLQMKERYGKKTA